jgi:uncharacterized protein (TIGR00369 family)
MSKHQEIISYLFELFRHEFGDQLDLPPSSMKALEIEFLDTDYDQFVKAKFPVNKSFANPLRFQQGGFYATYLDELFGPLSYITAKTPCLTSSLSLTYYRPLSIQENFIYGEANVLHKGKSIFHLEGILKNDKGQILAKGSCVCTKTKIKANEEEVQKY